MNLGGLISKFTSLDMGDVIEFVANQSIVAVQNSRKSKIDTYETSQTNQWVINTEDREFNLALKDSITLLQKKYDNKYSIFFKRGTLDEHSVCLIGISEKAEIIDSSSGFDEFDVTAEDNTSERTWKNILKHSPRYVLEKWKGFEDSEIDSLELEEDITDITYSLPYKKQVWIGRNMGVIMVLNKGHFQEVKDESLFDSLVEDETL